MINQARDILGIVRLLRIKTRQYAAGVMVVDALAQNAERAESHGLVVGVGAEQRSHDACQFAMQRTCYVFEQGVEGASRLDHFTGDDLAVPSGAARVEDAI